MGEDEYYYQIELTNKKLIFYFVAGAFALIVSFLAGVMVGRGVDEPSRQAAAEATRLDERIVPDGPTEAPAPEDLTYPQRLEAERLDDRLEPAQPAAAEPRRSAAAAPSPKPSTASPKPSTASPKPSPAASPSPRPSPRVPPPSVGPSPASTRPTAVAEDQPAASSPSETPAPSGPPGSLSVQVGAFQDRSAAEAIARQLKAKGFAAFVAPATRGGLFNVRVGTFADRPEAEKVLDQLRDGERLQPFIVSN